MEPLKTLEWVRDEIREILNHNGEVYDDLYALFRQVDEKITIEEQILDQMAKDMAEEWERNNAKH